MTEQKTVVLDTQQAPVVSLDDKFYKLVDKMDSLTLAAPSLKDAKSLTVKGPVKFDKGVVIKGDVLVVNGWSFSLLPLEWIGSKMVLMDSDQIL